MDSTKTKQKLDSNSFNLKILAVRERDPKKLSISHAAETCHPNDIHENTSPTDLFQIVGILLVFIR